MAPIARKEGMMGGINHAEGHQTRGQRDGGMPLGESIHIVSHGSPCGDKHGHNEDGGDGW